MHSKERSASAILAGTAYVTAALVVLAVVVSLALAFALLRRPRSPAVLRVALVVSAAISHAYYWYSFASVWCHFAAALSLMLAYVFYQLSPEKNAETTIAA